MTVFATFESDTEYFGSRGQQTVSASACKPGRDARAVARQSAEVAEETQEMEGVGCFGWVTDPEGNRVELWQAT